MYKAIRLDENGYFTGAYMEGTDKTLLERNGVLVDSLPEEEEKELWKAYKYKNGKWEKDEDKLNKLKSEKDKRNNNEILLEQMEQIKKQLSELDYHTMKYIEGEYTEQEWKIYKDKKKELRKKYNDLEKGLK